MKNYIEYFANGGDAEAPAGVVRKQFTDKRTGEQRESLFLPISLLEYLYRLFTNDERKDNKNKLKSTTNNTLVSSDNTIYGNLGKLASANGSAIKYVPNGDGTYTVHFAVKYPINLP